LLIEKGFVINGLDVTDTCNGVAKYSSGENPDSSSFRQNKEPWPEFGSGTFVLTKVLINESVICNDSKFYPRLSDSQAMKLLLIRKGSSISVNA
jgi:hypothetical protein